MKFVIVLVMIVNGKLSYGETHDFETLAECKSVLHRMIELHVADGMPLSNIMGDCYILADRK